MTVTSTEPRAAPSLVEHTRVFLRIGLLSFGGPAAQIALMHRELVEERPWLSEQEYLRALSFCMLLPGPEAMQLAAYAGWRLQGIAGGLIAGGLFILPGAAVIFALAFAYGVLIDAPLVQALFLGVKATVVVIVVQAIIRVARRALRRPMHWVLAGLAFLALFLFAVPFPLVVLVAGLWGALASGAPPAEATLPARFRPTALLATLSLGPAVWWAPVALAAIVGQGFLTDPGLFFSWFAVVTFGGAYAVLSYLAQEVVTGYRWVTAPQLMDALGLAETTPGPLILVTVFVSIVAGLNQGSVALGLAGGLMTLWVTFVPCFLWIFAGAPLVDWIAGRPRLQAALAAITAAVVGVILNLSVWFALHVLFTEVWAVEAGPLSDDPPGLDHPSAAGSGPLAPRGVAPARPPCLHACHAGRDRGPGGRAPPDWGGLRGPLSPAIKSPMLARDNLRRCSGDAFHRLWKPHASRHAWPDP